MELNEVILFLGIFVSIFIGVMWQLNRINPGKNQQKRAVSAADSSVSELYAVQTEQIKDIVKSKNNEIKSYQQRLRQLEPNIEENTENQKQITFEEITALVKQTYPKYLPMLPLMKKQIMEITKGMTLDQVLDYVKQITGNQQSQSVSDQQSSEYNKDWA